VESRICETSMDMNPHSSADTATPLKHGGQP